MLSSVRSLLVPELLLVRPVSPQKNVRTDDITPDVIHTLANR